jgi:sulfhydrogenase subunit delta
MDLLGKVKMAYFPMLQEKNELSKVDVAIVEGSISTEKQAEGIKKIRELSTFLIAIGSCATHGGINSLRNPMPNAARYVYGEKVQSSGMHAEGIDKYVHVDYYLRGCPPIKEEFTDVLNTILLKAKPLVYNQPVCSECRLKENLCLLQHGALCLGPITFGGCGALCPSNNLSCDGCRGQLADGNIKALTECLEANGIRKNNMKKLIEMYNTARIVLT